jgi:ribosomal protein S18
VGICEGSVAQQVDYDNPNTVKQFIKGDLKVLLEINTGMLMFAMEGF